MYALANAPKDARQNTRAIASIVINTVAAPEFVTSIKRNSITKSNAANILSDTEMGRARNRLCPLVTVCIFSVIYTKSELVPYLS